MVAQSRAMIGPWLAANAPTRLAIRGFLHRRRGRLPYRAQLRYELGLRHLAHLKIEAQEIGIDQRGQLADVVLKQRLADLRLDLIAVDDCRHVGAILFGEFCVMLQVEEQLAYPIIRHRCSSAVASKARSES